MEIVIIFGLAVTLFVIAGAATRSDRRKGTAGRSRVARGKQPRTTTRGTTGDEFVGTARSGTRIWVPPGRTVRVKGYQIDCGMLYVGSGLDAIVSYQGPEPALIDPKLPVAKSPDGTKGDLGYWPSYSTITAADRAGYLRWLSEGRRDPDAPLGYVFLFFYGLERRMYFDAARVADAAEEAPAILEEVEQLMEVYGGSRSLQRYAGQFLACVRANVAGESLSDLPPPRVSGSYEMPLALRIPLGEFVLAGKPIPAGWAYAWLRSDPGLRLRTSAKRCETEFRSLFTRRYSARFGDGVCVKPNKTLLDVTIQPASASFGGTLSISSHTLPDVSVLSRPLARLREIAEGCMEDLDGLSRFLGRNPAGRSSPAALAHLPEELVADALRGAFADLSSWCRAVSKAGNPVRAEAALAHWPTSSPNRMAKREAVEFAQALEKLGFGIEPDVRFLGAPLKGSDYCVVFPMPEDHPATPSHEYGCASLLLHLAAVVASADGEVSAEEEEALQQHLEKGLLLGDAECVRLSAHLRRLLAAPPSMAGLKSRMEPVSPRIRAQIARFAVTVAGSDGVIDRSEVRILERIYQMLGLDAEQLAADVAALGPVTSPGPADGPVTVRAAGEAAPGFSIPGPEPAKRPARAGALQLDMERVKSTMAQTTEVAAFLSEIFVDESEGDAAQPSEVAAGSDEIAGLDGAHSRLLRALADRAVWERGEYEDLAERHGLLADGALELLNEFAWDTCGSALIEEEDGLVINKEALEEILK